jgi:hypothetical protein
MNLMNRFIFIEWACSFLRGPLLVCLIWADLQDMKINQHFTSTPRMNPYLMSSGHRQSWPGLWTTW